MLDVETISRHRETLTHLVIASRDRLVSECGQLPIDAEQRAAYLETFDYVARDMAVFESEHELATFATGQLRALMELLSQESFPVLSRVSFSAYLSSRVDGRTLIDALNKLPALRALSIEGVCWGYGLIESFCDALLAKDQLLRLDLGTEFAAPRCTARTTIRILTALTTNRSIQRFAFDANVRGASDTGVADALVGVLDNNKTLTTFLLSGQFGHKDSSRIFMALASNESIAITDLCAALVLFPRGACADFGSLVTQSSRLTHLHIALTPHTPAHYTSAMNASLVFSFLKQSNSIQAVTFDPASTIIPDDVQTKLDENAGLNNYILK